MKTKKITKIITILFMIVMILGAVNMVFATGPAIPTPTEPNGAKQVENIAGMVINCFCSRCYYVSILRNKIRYSITRRKSRS